MPRCVCLAGSGNVIAKLQSVVGLGAANKPEDVVAVKRRLIELGFDWLAPDEAAGPETVKTIMLFQAIKNGFNRVNDTRNDWRVDPDGETLKWLNAANAPRWQLLPAGKRSEGFINFELTQISDNHDFGTRWLAETIIGAGAAYRDDFLAERPNAALIAVNDISLPRGGPTPMHETHQSGMCCDLRLPRKDGQSGGITVTDQAYDRAAMRAMLRALKKQKLASRILLNDQALVSQGLCVAASGHHNHAHFEIKPPARLAAETV